MTSFEVVQVDRLDCRLEPYSWDFVADRAAEIDANWVRLTAERSGVYNGKVLLQHRGGLVEAGGERVWRGAYFETDFKPFIAWRDLGRPGRQIRNFFSMAALTAADGALVLGEMAAHTASAGMVYFPAGTPDLSDVRDGAIDLYASVRRELAEETGLGAHEVTFEPGWTLVVGPHQVACMKRVRSPLGAQALAERIGVFLRHEAGPELARVHVVRNMDAAAPLRMPPFMPVYLEWAFAQPG